MTDHAPRTCTSVSCNAEFVPTRGTQRRCPACREQSTNGQYAPRTRRSPLQVQLRSTQQVEALVNMQQAIDAMVAARDELKSFAETAASRRLTKLERERALVEPLSRLNLARRFLTATLRSYGYESDDAKETA